MSLDIDRSTASDSQAHNGLTFPQTSPKEAEENLKENDTDCNRVISIETFKRSRSKSKRTPDYVVAHADARWHGRIVEIPTDRIEPHRDANRDATALTPESLCELHAQIQTAGRNEVPAIVMPVLTDRADDPSHQPRYALIAGRRRLETCRRLGLPLRCEVRHGLDDRAARILMARENNGRRDLSMWEIGGMLRRHLAGSAGLDTKTAATELGVDYTSATRALKLRGLADGMAKEVMACIADLTALTQLDVKWLISTFGEKPDEEQSRKIMAVYIEAARLREEARPLGHRETMKRLRAAATVGQTNSSPAGESTVETSRPLNAGMALIDFNRLGAPQLLIDPPPSESEQAELQALVA